MVKVLEVSVPNISNYQACLVGHQKKQNEKDITDSLSKISNISNQIQLVEKNKKLSHEEKINQI